MKVKFQHESDLSWTTQQIVDVQDNVSEEDIEAMFPIVLGVSYNQNDCYYEVIGNGHIFTLGEMLKYTD